MLLPTLQTGRTASQSYASYREACLALSEKRNKCLARAAEAWKAGNSADARHWSREGQSLNKVIQEESKSLARSIVRSRHDELRVRIAGDAGSQSGLLEAATDERGARGLRGKAMGGDLGVCLGVVPARNPLVPSMAKLSTEERTEVLMDCHLLHASEAVDLIEEFLMALEREQFRGLAMLAVGLGKHTSSQTDRRRVGLASAVKGFLDTWHYPYAEHDGILVVDPINHL
jgi:chorismate mutase